MSEDVRVKVGLDAGGVTTGLAQLRSEVEATTARIEGSFKHATSLQNLIGFGLFEEGIRHVIEYGAKIEDLSRRFGVSARELQVVGNAAELVGVGLDQVAVSLNKLDVARSKALGGSEGLVGAFGRLNVTVEDLQKLSLPALLQKIGSSGMDASDMALVLGRNGTALREVLRGLSDGTIKYTTSVIENTAALKAADDVWKTVGQAAKIYSANIVGGFINIAIAWRNLVTDFRSGLSVVDLLRTSLAQMAYTVPFPYHTKLGNWLTPDAVKKAHESDWNKTGHGGTDDEGNVVGGSGRGSSLEEREHALYLRMLDDEEKLKALRQDRADQEEKISRMRRDEHSTDEEINAEESKLLDIVGEVDSAEKSVAKTREHAQSLLEAGLNKVDSLVGKRKEETLESEKQNRLAGEQNALLQAELQGRSRDAHYLRQAFNVSEQILSVEQRIQKAREAGDNALAGQLTKTQQLLKLELARIQNEYQAENERAFWEPNGLTSFSTEGMPKTQALLGALGGGAGFGLNYAFAHAMDSSGRAKDEDVARYLAEFATKTDNGRRNLAWQDQLFVDKAFQNLGARQQTALATSMINEHRNSLQLAQQVARGGFDSSSIGLLLQSMIAQQQQTNTALQQTNALLQPQPGSH